MRLIAGRAYGETAPVETLSDMFISMHGSPRAFVGLPEDHVEGAVYVVEGSIHCNRIRSTPG